MSTQPLEIYRDRHLSGSRTLELFEDKITVSGYEAFKSNFKIDVPLNALETKSGHIQVRENTGLLGLVSFGGGVYLMVDWTKYADFTTKPGFWVGAIFSLLGLYLLLRALRRVEHAIFYTPAGVARLGIRRSGPDKERFHAFVDRVTAQISACRALSETKAAPTNL
ncbi:hypothetical protein [Roseimicrobium gellanilyticum]|nr:hypothetical protein [Roseimicrobium gellanilyticum]